MVNAMEGWLLELDSKAPDTRRQYLDHFKRFCEKEGLTPEDIYSLYSTGDPQRKHELEARLKRHMKAMKDSGYSASTCRMAYKAMSSFFEAQGLKFSLKAKDQPRGQSNGQRRAKKEQIMKLYEYVSPEFRLRNRAMITFFKDSGLRSSDVAALNVEHYRRSRLVIYEGEKFRVFEPFETRKTGHIAYIHIGPEAIEDLDNYLVDRARKTGGEIPGKKPLFAIRGGERFSKGAVSNLVFRMAKHLGDEGRKISSHSLRKFHTTELEGEMNSSWITKLQGKNLGGGWAPYSHPEGDGETFDPDKLTEAYRRAYKVLRIKSSKTEEDKKRDDERAKMQKRIAELEEQTKDWQAFKNLFIQNREVWVEQEAQVREQLVKQRLRERLAMDPKIVKEFDRIAAELEKNTTFKDEKERR